MERSRFDSLVSAVAESRSRRDTLRLFGLALVGGAGVLAADEAEARRKKKGKKKKGKGNQSPPPPPGLALRTICTPGQSVCAGKLRCDAPTTRQSCNSTVEDIDAWCCVAPGDPCTECDCCGDFYCGSNNNGDLACIPNFDDD